MQRPLQILFMSAAVFCFVVPAAVAADRVKTANGVLEGVGEPNAAVRMFKGIPFAAPPVGNLRWREPQPAADWTGVREAKQFAARCMQLPLFGDMGFRANGMGEDCLYLNVWTPAKTAAANAVRVSNRPALEKILSDVFRERAAAEWLDRLHAAGIPCSLVRSFPEVVEHPQAAFREMFPVIDHPTAGAHRVTGTPVKMSETPGSPSAGAPLLGMHTRGVLMELLDLDESTVEKFAASGVVFEAEPVSCP